MMRARRKRFAIAIGDRIRVAGLTPDNPNHANVFEVRGFVDDEVVLRLPRTQRVGWIYSTQPRWWIERGDTYERVVDSVVPSPPG